MRKIVLAGGSGHLGTLLAEAFLDLGWDVTVLSRQRDKRDGPVDYIFWNGEHLGPWTNVLEGADTVINLSGKNIQCRFTPRNKALLDHSRILPTNALGRAIAQCYKPPRLWINFSGLSIFSGLNEMQDETSIAVGSGYLAQLTRRWEAAASAFELSDTARVILRVSPVLTRQQGMFAELLRLTRWRLGGKVAEGKQLVSWIHEHDFVQLVQWVIEQSNPRRIYHACSPNPITQAALMKTIRESTGISFGLPLPRPLVHIGALVKGIDPSVLLDSVPATTRYTVEDGFAFTYGKPRDAIVNLVTGA